MSFLDELSKNTNEAYTGNFAKSNKSTLDPLLDFFSKAGAMRGREEDAYQLFLKAYAKDKLAAIRCLFYLRDIRGGQGERSVFQYILRKLDDETFKKVIKYVPEYGRWDDSPIKESTVEYIKKQLEEDNKNLEEGKSISLLAKWMPSISTTSAETRKEAEQLAKLLDLKPRQYRKLTSKLRAKLDLLEHKMTNKEWSEIDYSKVPSQAHKKHVKAFLRNDEERYREFLGQVKKGDKKVNTATLYTYQLYDKVRNTRDSGEIESANVLWENLPDYTRGANALVLADVSGSMMGLPMSISVSLALYFAERNEGPFKDYFMTFTSKPKLQKIHGDNLKEKMDSIERSEWHMSTNIQAAFNSILDAAINSGASQDDMPRTLYIVSDMQFDVATSRNDSTNFEVAEKKFKNAGYELPHVVFWNVNAWGGDTPATKYDKHVTLISGASQSTFKHVVEGKTPIELMLEILNSERYAQIRI